jgi:hypothetical protein
MVSLASVIRHCFGLSIAIYLRPAKRLFEARTLRCLRSLNFTILTVSQIMGVTLTAANWSFIKPIVKHEM